MLEEMLYEDHLRILYTALKECPAMHDAICLFKTWLHQRSFKVRIKAVLAGKLALQKLKTNKKRSMYSHKNSFFYIFLT